MSNQQVSSPDALLRPTNMIEIAPGWHWGTLDDEKIIYQILGRPQRSAIDEWVKRSIALRTNWDSTQPIAILMDVEHIHDILTPYLRAKTPEIMRVRSHIPTLTAVITGNNFSSKLIEVFTASLGMLIPGLTIRTFQTGEQAMRWLQFKRRVHDIVLPVPSA